MLHYSEVAWCEGVLQDRQVHFILDTVADAPPVLVAVDRVPGVVHVVVVVSVVLVGRRVTTRHS